MDYVVCLNLLPGTYQYKFIVDSEWRFAPDQPTVRDEMGNINNCLTVEDQQMYLHEDPCSGFFGDNPNNAYTQVLPDEITLAKEPPPAPVHLTVMPLNVSAAPQPSIASWSLPPPLSVTLQHMCVQRSSPRVTAISTTQRFRSKYVTIVIYKPRSLTLIDDLNPGDQHNVLYDGWLFRGDQSQHSLRWSQPIQPQQQQLQTQQLAAPQSRVSWFDAQRQAHFSNGFGVGYGQQQMGIQHMMPPPHETPQVMAGNATEPSQVTTPELMDLGSRPASHAAFMDTSADHFSRE